MAFDQPKEQVDIGQFQKSDTSSIEARISMFENTAKIDIREYVYTSKYTGPTKKGINIDVECFPEFWDMVCEIRDYLLENGMIDDEEEEA